MLEQKIEELDDRREQLVALKIQREILCMAIQCVTGIQFSVWTKNSKRIHTICKEIFCHNIDKDGVLSLEEIGEWIGKDHSAASRYIDAYSNDYKTDAEFKLIADSVKNLISLHHENHA